MKNIVNEEKLELNRDERKRKQEGIQQSAGKEENDDTHKYKKLEWGMMRNVIATQPNVRGTLCWMLLLLKCAGVPLTRQQISAVCEPKFTTFWGHVEEKLMFNKFFLRLSIYALVAKVWPDKVVQWCADGNFLRPVFSASHGQLNSHAHSKFEGHTTCGSVVDIQSATTENRQGKKRKKEKETRKNKEERNHICKI